MLRSPSAAVLALAICACEPSLPQVEPTPTVTAMFDPTTGKIPLPNDLVFATPINSVCPAPANALTAPTDPPACAQAELLRAFNPSGRFPFAGAFPSDQEVPLTIQFTKNTYVNGRLKLVAPDLDLATITPATLAVVDSKGNPVELEAPVPGDYVILKNGDTLDDHGTLSVHRKGHLPWATGSYSLVLRGGASGVKTTDSPPIPVTPSPVFDLVQQGKDMTAPENLGLLKAQNNGSTEEALAQGAQLNGLILLYQGTAFPAADKVFQTRQELAIASTFQIDKTVTNVTVDPARGLAPLPFDVLRDATTGKITATAACSLAGGKLDQDGKCSQPAAAGFTTLDGFSTTGAILAPTSAPIKVETLTGQTLKLFDLSDPKNPVEVPTDVPTGSLIREPCEFTSRLIPGAIPSCSANPAGFAPVIAFQPAGATSDPLDGGSSVFRTQPLKDNTDYAVVMTNGIHDMADQPIGQGTVAKILRFTNPLVVGGHSALQGIDDGTAASLDKMRKQLVPVFDKLGKDVAPTVAMAYTFHTQTVIAPAVALTAFPYTEPSVTALPKADSLKFSDATTAFTKWGVPPGVPSDKIAEILEVDISTFNALDPATGAFTPPDQNGQIKTATEQIHVLIATPDPNQVTIPTCPGSTLKCSPLVVFRHGLGRGRADMLLIANAFASVGMTTVAIDAAKHGDRTLCSSGAPAGQSGCVGVCTAIPMAAGQGDPTPPGPPGTCDQLGLAKKGLNGVPVTTADKDGIPVASANYLVSANFFRTRDTLRQDLIDESQLIRVMAVDPTKLPPGAHHVVFEHMSQTNGVIIDPATVYYAGQSLGAIQGTLSVATNPRILRAGLNVGGGTIVDIFTNAPAFDTQIKALLDGLHIVKGSKEYLQFLTVAKTILDPADPVNFAAHITANNLPDLLTPRGNPNGTVPQLPKQVLIQMANCDEVVPNPFGLVWSSNLAFAAARATPPSAPLGPLPNSPQAFFGGGNGTFQLFAGSGFTPASFGHPEQCTDATAAGLLTNGGGHGFLLLSVEHPDLTAKAQGNLASFMATGNPVPSVTLAAP